MDGVSFNGICGCVGVIENLDQSCLTEDEVPITHCPTPLVEFKDTATCHELYSTVRSHLKEFVV